MSSKVKPSDFRPIALSGESTVVAEFQSERARETAYQSEADLERRFIQQLESQAYEYFPITTEEELISNLRCQLEKLNKIEFSDKEWACFFATSISRANDGIREKTERIQNDSIQLLKRDDGSEKNIHLIDKKNIHNNSLQVINQYEESKGKRATRYDVTILVNGLPLVHVELKRRGVALREAFNQINRYQRDSFWAGSGLYQYVQVFVISNGTLTKYYTNTVREKHVRKEKVRSRDKTSNSFSFTTWWASFQNQRIEELTDFTATFFAKHTLLNILTRYCVFDAEQNLLVMRPYQIAATEQILQRIAINRQIFGRRATSGYIWHTTGSGKTLTSFKAAQLAQSMPQIEKVLFVVDRKDLDYQTMQEYDRFQKGAANSNTSIKVLQRQLEDPRARIIITTIQKLSRFVVKNRTHPVYQMNTVIIFDECHRSQFGDMNKDITRAFKKCHLFGFTGTPIFSENAIRQEHLGNRTTEQIFGERLHTYTIVDAIRDKNVLPFRIDYINTIKSSPDIQDKSVSAIATEQALLDPERITKIVSYIREHFAQKTRKNYHGSGRKQSEFNSLFATSSIEAAKRYYEEFARQQEDLPSQQQLRVGLIFSFAANEEEYDGILNEEGFETEKLDQSSRDFLDDAIKDYNKLFKTNFDTSAKKFQNYYKDVSHRLRDQELDILIVVNMFLTGFDATKLNTLWVDKNLHSHGLIQAYSRTNRILNSVKTYGNIVSFRDLEQATNDALALFGNKEAKDIVLLKPYAYYYQEYQEKIQTLQDTVPLGEDLISETAQKKFIQLFGKILKLKNILTAFDDFKGNEILSDRTFQDYQSLYLNLYNEFRIVSNTERENINDDLVFEIELIKSVEINVDYILMLVEKFLDQRGRRGEEDIRHSIASAINSSPNLRSKKDLIDQFVDSISAKSRVGEKWRSFIVAKKDEEFDQIIADECLNKPKAKEFIKNAFRNGSIPATGTSLTEILPSKSRFGPNKEYELQKHAVLQKLEAFFERFHGLIGEY